ncbi:MAG: Asp-tRNA(Asn)/Glu-tRNA(Gln) amidotransferase subunit GatC [Neisseriaceae bacterium]
MIEKAELQKLGRLAYLSLTEQEIEAFQSELNHFFSMVQIMHSIDGKYDLNTVQPFVHPYAQYQLLREDRAKVVEELEQFQEVAPEIKEGFYIVPKVIE